jgi:hypothetical protein
MGREAARIVLTILLATLVVVGAIAIYYSPFHSTSCPVGSASQGMATSQTTTMTSTSTIPAAQTYTSSVTPFDSCLAVSPLGSLQTTTNASAIAEALAANLGQLPLRFVSAYSTTCANGSPQCPNSTTLFPTYLFQTARDSNITVTFLGGSFFELEYLVNNYSSYNDYWNSHPFGNPPPAAADAAVSSLMLKAFNLDLSKVALNDGVQGPGWQQWTQEYDGLQIANGGVVQFEIYPPTSAVIELLIVQGSGWHVIPSNFPLDVPASTALNAAEEYASTDLHMGFLSYASISLQVIQDHLYYAATVSDQSRTYVLFVNPITGGVGFPQS